MTASKVISKITLKWKMLIWLKIIVAWVLMLGCCYLALLVDFSLQWQLLLIATSLVIAWLLYRRQLPTKTQVHVLANAQLPSLEYSVSLIEDDPKSPLAALQREKINTQLLSSYTQVKYPVQWWDLFWLCIIGIFLSLTIRLAPLVSDSAPDARSIVAISQPDVVQTPQQMTYQAQVSIVPPRYTLLATRNQQQLNLNKVLSGSKISWTFVFNREPKACWLIFSAGDSITLHHKNNNWTTSIRAKTKGFYLLNYMDQNEKKHTSEFFKLDVIPDNPPEVKINGIPQYQSVFPGEKEETKFIATATDEFGLSDAYLIATITKGSGESVKFREERIEFNQPVTGHSFKEAITFTSEQFDMKPGNELYFYLEARDNHQPSQVRRTETYFFVLEDTSEIVFSLQGSLGVDLMPEYFRSQRQIIIDSEKLLASQSATTKEEFNQRSNELGFDQKTLRLKYGQFLGEEADSGLDIENEVEEVPAAQHPGQVNVLSEFGHDHDHENEAGQLMDNGTEQQENPVDDLSHSHDDLDQATFFGKSIKGKLRAALNEMWDAELYLRLFQPEASLPYQYRALKLIKEIKNHARIYVHRMGFDAPPIKEVESRLTGDLDHVHGEEYTSSTTYLQQFDQTKILINTISDLEQNTFPQPNSLESELQAAGNEIARRAIEEPGKYLQLLTEIRKVSNQVELTRSELVTLKRNLMKVITATEHKPTLKQYSSHQLLDVFIEELTKSDI